MNSTALAILQPQDLDTIQRTGKLLAASGYFDGRGDGSPPGAQAIAQMATKIMAGREMGFGPFASVNGVHIINGKPSIGANLMASAIKANGRYNYRVREMSGDKCAIEFFERDGDKWESIGVSEFTLQDAQAAGLTKNPTWSKFPKNMLFARAISNGVRFYCPDVFSGNAVYVPEELGASTDNDGNIVEASYTVTKPADRSVDSTTGEITSQQPAMQPIDEHFGMGDLQNHIEEERMGVGEAADGGVSPMGGVNPWNDDAAATDTAKTLSKAQLTRLNVLGVDFYGSKTEWDAKRPELVAAATTGAVTSSKQLSPSEADLLIKGLEKRLKEKQEQARAKAAAQAKAAQAQQPAMKVAA